MDERVALIQMLVDFIDEPRLSLKQYGRPIDRRMQEVSAMPIQNPEIVIYWDLIYQKLSIVYDLYPTIGTVCKLYDEQLREVAGDDTVCKQLTADLQSLQSILCDSRPIQLSGLMLAHRIARVFNACKTTIGVQIMPSTFARAITVYTEAIKLLGEVRRALVELE